MRARIFFMALGLLISLLLPAQDLDLNQFKSMAPRNIGPGGMSGRVTCIDALHSNPDVIFVGTASGGLWRSESGGIRWEPVFDRQPIQSIGAVAIDQRNPDVIWAGTGEGNPRNSQSSGAGIYKSLDGGRTWKLMGLEQSKTIHRIIIHRDNPDIVYVGALGSAWGPNPDRGVFKTTNGGESWEKVLFVNDSTGCADLVADPSNPNKLLAAMWEYGRKPWTFTSGGKGSGLFVTLDGGKTWQQRGNKQGLPEGNLGRIGLAIAPSQPKRIYALVEAKKTALYRSDDGGQMWAKITDKNIGSRPFYYADIFVDPANENRLYNLHSVVTVSEDGGSTFETLLPWEEVHPDHHAWWVHPHDPDFILEGNDGGLAISRDRGKTWRFAENIPVAQFYHINYDLEIPYNVYGGMQDNGSWRGPSQVWKHGGIKNSEWQELLFGDGFDVVSQPGNSRFGYAMSQGGNVSRYDYETGATQFIKPVHPAGLPLRFNWNAAIAQSPQESCTVYFGSQFLHRSTDCGNSWEIISPDLTTNDSTKMKQAKSGGLTIDATQAENFVTIISIAPSPKDPEVIWVGTDDGNLQLTTNGGRDWTNLSAKLPGAPKGAWIPQIEASRHAAGEAFVVMNDYRRNNWAPYLFHTRDYGKTWRSLVSAKEVTGHCLSVVQDPIESNLLFLGTEQGLYFSLNGGQHWQHWDQNFPSVPVFDMKIHERDHDLILATFGRAAWIMDDIRPLRRIAAEGTELLNKPLVLFGPPDAWQVSRKSFTGIRFSAGAGYAGKNKGNHATFSFWLKDPNPPKTQKDKGKEDGKGEEDKKDEGEGADKSQAKKDPRFNKKVRLTLITEVGDTIWDFAHKPDTGLNRIGWGLNEKGVYYPSPRSPKDSDNHPQGMDAMPGKYKVFLGFGEFKDSTWITVHPDPRVKYDQEQLLRKRTWLKKQEKLASTAWKAVEDLKKAKKQSQDLAPVLDRLDEAVKDSLTKDGKAVTDSIEALLDLFYRSREEEGYDHVTERLTGKLFRSNDYLSSSFGEVGGNAINAYQTVEKEIMKAHTRINRFWRETWKPYQEKINRLSVPLLDSFE
ncbi:MAG: hypothetical protein H6581_21375 [Bacteroidia bacterium]|nr:hypothetical protein [Bacteroidia bacterium]